MNTARQFGSLFACPNEARDWNYVLIIAWRETVLMHHLANIFGWIVRIYGKLQARLTA